MEEHNVLEMGKEPMLPSTDQTNRTTEITHENDADDNLEQQEIRYDQELNVKTEERGSLLTEATEPVKHRPDQTHRTTEITPKIDTDDDLERQGTGYEELNVKTEEQSSLLTEEASMDQDLCRALRSKHADPLRRLLENTPLILSEQTTVTKKNALHIAVMYGHKVVVQEVFGSCQSLLTSADEMGYTPLHTAAESGRSRIVEVLIGHGTPIPSGLFQMKSDQFGLTALDLAAMNGHLEVVKVFTNVKEDLLWAQSPSPLFYATIFGQWEVVYHILSFSGAQNHSLTSDAVFGPSPLHQAISAKREDVAAKLLAKVPEYAFGFDDKLGTPLHHASYLGMLKTVRHLLILNSSASYRKDKRGNFPIHRAAEGGDVHVYEELMKHCSDLEDSANDDDMTVLHLAVVRNRFSLVRHILETTRNNNLVNAIDSIKNTALHYAVTKDLIWHVFLLLDNERINVRIRNAAQELPRDIITSAMEGNWGMPFSLKAAIYSAIMDAHGFSDPESLSKHISRRHKSISGPDVEGKWRGIANNLLVAATLVATTSFASIFNLPGQYEGSGGKQGLAHFRNKTLFKFFTLIDALALFSSITTAVLVILGAWTDTLGLVFVVPWALKMATLAFISMSVAFILALILMINYVSWQLILLSILGLIILVILLLILLGVTSPARAYWRAYAFFRRILWLLPRRVWSSFSGLSFEARKWRRWVFIPRFGNANNRISFYAKLGRKPSQTAQRQSL